MPISVHFLTADHSAGQLVLQWGRTELHTQYPWSPSLRKSLELKQTVSTHTDNWRTGLGIRCGRVGLPTRVSTFRYAYRVTEDSSADGSTQCFLLLSAYPYKGFRHELTAIAFLYSPGIRLFQPLKCRLPAAKYILPPFQTCRSSTAVCSATSSAHPSQDVSVNTQRIGLPLPTRPLAQLLLAVIYAPCLCNLDTASRTMQHFAPPGTTPPSFSRQTFCSSRSSCLGLGPQVSTLR